MTKGRFIAMSFNMAHRTLCGAPNFSEATLFQSDLSRLHEIACISELSDNLII
jgi:hypothetical protein